MRWRNCKVYVPGLQPTRLLESQTLYLEVGSPPSAETIRLLAHDLWNAGWFHKNLHKPLFSTRPVCIMEDGEYELTNRIIWCDLEDMSFRLVSPTCLWAAIPHKEALDGSVSQGVCMVPKSSFKSEFWVCKLRKMEMVYAKWVPSQILITCRKCSTSRTTSSLSLSTIVPLCKKGIFPYQNHRIIDLDRYHISR